MKKTLIALAAVAAVGAASAQVTVYGKVAGGVTTSSTTGTSITSSGYEGSRIGVKGSTDLGSGMTGSFQLEGGLDLNSRAAKTVSLFDRVANFSVSGGFGTVAVGTLWSQYDSYIGTGDSMEYNGFSPLGAVMAAYDVGNTGFGNVQGSIAYTTPVISGFQVTAQIAPNAGILQTNYSGVGVSFNQGPISLGLGTQDYNLAAGNVKSWAAGAAYNLGVATVYAGANATDDRALATKSMGSTFGLKVPMGAGYATAGYAMNTATLGTVDTKSSSTGVQYIHNWNKATVIYAGYISTTTTATVNTTGAGVRYNF